MISPIASRFLRVRLPAPLLLVTVLLVACVSAPLVAQTAEGHITAQALFQERCKTAGEKIYRTVEGVEGIYLLKIRPSEINYGDQFKMDDPYGRDLGGAGYIESFIQGSYQRGKRERPEGGPARIGYRFIEAQDEQDGRRYRYTGSIKATGRMEATAPNVQIELKRNPNFDLNIYRFVVDKVPATGRAPRYGVTYDDISTHQERTHWIAGSSLKVIDLQTKEIMGERIGYMVDWAQGSRAGQRSPWLFAADNACPSFLRNFKILKNGTGPAFPSQMYQTLDFVEKVLKPTK